MLLPAGYQPTCIILYGFQKNPIKFNVTVPPLPKQSANTKHKTHVLSICSIFYLLLKWHHSMISKSVEPRYLKPIKSNNLTPVKFGDNRLACKKNHFVGNEIMTFVFL